MYLYVNFNQQNNQFDKQMSIPNSFMFRRGHWIKVYNLCFEMYDNSDGTWSCDTIPKPTLIVVEFSSVQFFCWISELPKKNIYKMINKKIINLLERNWIIYEQKVCKAKENEECKQLGGYNISSLTPTRLTQLQQQWFFNNWLLLVTMDKQFIKIIIYSFK